MENSFLQLIIHDIKVIFITIFIVLLFNSRFLIQLLRKEINIDNKIGYDKEDDIDFSGYSSTVKPIAIYNIDNNIIKHNIFQIKNNKIIINELKKIFDLSKNHGIYGFAFYYQFYFERKFLYDPLSIIIQNKEIKINYFIIFNNNKSNATMEINIYKIFEDIRQYILDERYIKFYNKYVIGLNNYSLKNKKLLILRKIFYKNKLGEIFILSRTYKFNIS